MAPEGEKPGTEIHTADAQGDGPQARPEALRHGDRPGDVEHRHDPQDGKGGGHRPRDDAGILRLEQEGEKPQRHSLESRVDRGPKGRPARPPPRARPTTKAPSVPRRQTAAPPSPRRAPRNESRAPTEASPHKKAAFAAAPATVMRPEANTEPLSKKRSANAGGWHQVASSPSSGKHTPSRDRRQAAPKPSDFLGVPRARDEAARPPTAPPGRRIGQRGDRPGRSRRRDASGRPGPGVPPTRAGTSPAEEVRGSEPPG